MVASDRPTPLRRHKVQQMMSNPETMREMVRMNPQLNRLMEQRPEIARILEDPEMLQQSMRMAANPSLMREMMRNADRAMGHLDAMPGGFFLSVYIFKFLAMLSGG